MSRRASIFAKEHPGKPKVRFPDDLVFLDNMKENDMDAMAHMLRRTSLQMDISEINNTGMTPLHQAVLDANIVAVRLLVKHGADLNKQDEDTWTPLHAACAEGYIDITRCLLEQGARKDIITDEGERPIDLVDPSDFQFISLMLGGDRFYGTPAHGDDYSEEEEEQACGLTENGRLGEKPEGEKQQQPEPAITTVDHQDPPPECAGAT